MSKMNDEQFNVFVHKTIWGNTFPQNSSWFVYYDLNTLISERGADFITKYFAKEATNARTHGVTLLAVCNFKEVGETAASFLQRASDGVVRTWVHNSYQYLQVTKLPGGHVSDLQIIEHIPDTPYVRLV